MISGAAARSSHRLYFVTVLSLPSLLDLQPAATACFFISLTLVPIAHHLVTRRTLTHLDPVFLIGFLYAISYPLAYLALGELTGIMAMTESNLPSVLRWSYRGFSCFLLAYMLVRMKISSGVTKRSRDFPDAREAGIIYRFASLAGLVGFLGQVGLLLFYGGAAYAFLESEGSFRDSTIEMVLHYTSLAVHVFFFLYVFLRIRSFRRKSLDIQFLVVLVIQLVLAVGSGAKGIFLSMLLSFFLPWILFARKLTFRKGMVTGIAGIAAIYIVFAIVNDYRTYVRNSYSGRGSDIVGTTIFQWENFGKSVLGNVFHSGSSPENTGGERDLSEEIISRFGTGLYSFSSLLYFSGGVSPHADRYTSFLLPVYAFLPRSVFPEKPVYFHAGEHAKMHGWEYGGISVSLIGSLYWAWGPTGICLGMAVVGLLLALITHMALHPGRLWVLFISIFHLTYLALLDVGVTFHAIGTDLIRFTLFFYLLYKVSMSTLFAPGKRVVYETN